MSRARQGGLRPNRRHVQRGSDMISFVLDVGGKIQSAFPRFFHQPPIPGRWQPCRTVGRNPAVALVAQSDSERLTTDQEVAGSNPVRGTWGGKPFRCLSSASCSTCVGSLTAEYRSPKPVGVRSRLTRRARTVLFGSLLTDSSSRMIPSHPHRILPHDRHPVLPLSFGMLRLISHEGRPWWGSGRPGSRSPNGRGMVLKISQCGFESRRKHDAWHKAMCKRNIANTVVSADHARKEGGKRGCPGNNNIPKNELLLWKRVVAFLEPKWASTLLP